MDIVNKAFMLELSYRLTIAVDMAANKHKQPSWREDWHNKLRLRAAEWIRFLNGLINDNDSVEAMIAHKLRNVTAGLPLEYKEIYANAWEPGRDVSVYRYSLGLLHDMTDIAEYAGRRLLEYFSFGRQLAMEDMKMFIEQMEGSPQSYTTNTPPIMPKNSKLPTGLIPESINVNTRKEIEKLYEHRSLFVNKQSSFSMRGWIQLFMALLNPERSHSFLWGVPSPYSPKQSFILAAGKILPRPAVIHLKTGRDQALMKLAARMEIDKKDDLPPAGCGWENSKGLWTDDARVRSTLQDAREMLGDLARPLGELEYVDGRKTNLPHSGHLRLPEAWAFRDAVVLV